MRINIPDYIRICIDRLEEKGYEAYIVGGCVRDSILNRVPNDWDVCTSALPNEIKSVFKDYKTIDVGIEHGTVAVLIDKVAVEITTFRIDGEYTDNRRPDYVEFTSSLKEDLKRRDFTINAMAYSDKRGIIDYFDGRGDIEKSLIRCVGDAETRFNEDALRIMRGIRFASQLGYSIEEKTYEAMASCRSHVKNISAERIREELTKLIMGSYADSGVRLLTQLDLIPVIFSGLMVSKECDDYESLFKIVDQFKKLPKDLYVRLCVFLKFVMDIYKFHHEKESGLDLLLLRRLRYNNATINETHVLFENYNAPLSSDRIEIKNMLNKIGAESYRKLLQIKKAEAEDKYDFDGIESELKGIIDKGEPYELKQLKINGGDLLNLGVPKGKAVGEALNRLMKTVIEHPEYNNKETLTKLCLEMIR